MAQRLTASTGPDRPLPAAGRIVSVHVGPAVPARLAGRDVLTGMRKPAQPSAVAAPTGLVGDGQGDRRVHGGADKAVCLYPSEHYAHWLGALGKRWAPGAFGENVSMSGLLETEVRLGDVLRIGTVAMQVTQPRRTCYRLSAWHGHLDLAELVQQSGRTGFYARVLSAGELRPGDTVQIETSPHGATVAHVNRVMNLEPFDPDAAQALLKTEELPTKWRRSLEARLRTGVPEGHTHRLRGPDA